VEELEHAHPQQRPVEGRHALDRPVLGVAGDPLVELVQVGAHPGDHLGRERRRLHRQGGQDGRGRHVLALGLVEQRERPLPGLPTAPAGVGDHV
jgi:hypothetical protein